MVHRAAVVVSEKDVKSYTPIKNGSLFIFVHMHGCPYCEAMLSQWFLFQNTTQTNTLMVERSVLPKIKRVDTRLKNLEPTHFPYLILVPNINNTASAWIPYTDSSDRTASSFEAFVKHNARSSSRSSKSTTSTSKPRKNNLKH